ncbi:MAG: hypothetical protein JXR91_07015 [Deltaproteobacteria bacterium]|nr:hypothetical protein [Deltaproteobacteria bacterium]
MNTLAMVLTVVGTGFCFIPGFLGFLGIGIAIFGLITGIAGMTSVKTSPGNLGMDIASFIYGFTGLSVGMGFQIKFSNGHLDMLLLPLLESKLIILFFTGLILFIAVQLLSRKKWRAAGICAAVILYLFTSSAAWTILTIFERSGRSII